MVVPVPAFEGGDRKSNSDPSTRTPPTWNQSERNCTRFISNSANLSIYTYSLYCVILGGFTTNMVSPGTRDVFGRSWLPRDGFHVPVKIPTLPLPVELGGSTNFGGSGRDIASTVLFMMNNWYLNGECCLCCTSECSFRFLYQVKLFSLMVEYVLQSFARFQIC